MAECVSDPPVIVLAGGISVMTAVLRRLLVLEAKGVRFIVLQDEHFECEPANLLSVDDLSFLREYRAEAFRALRYQVPTCH